MPSFVVKPEREQDFYVVWSTVVDAPCYWGSVAELALLPHARATAERIARADEYGTSMCDPALPRDEQWFGWDDDAFLLMEAEIPNRRDDGAYLVPRTNLRALCERLDRAEDITDLLTFEVDNDESPAQSED